MIREQYKQQIDTYRHIHYSAQREETAYAGAIALALILAPIIALALTVLQAP